MYYQLRNIRRLLHDLKGAMELIPSIQTYDWGKYGSDSKVAVLYKNVIPDFTIEPNKTYAELWMGTHVNGSSLVKTLQKTLLEVISHKPQYLGDTVVHKFGKNLPFLFKILSIRKALSIQVHPSKAHAEQLHLKSPDIYKDPNHKPELAIALTPFEALIGFRPFIEIVNYLRIIPELQNIIGSDLCDVFIKTSTKTNLKNCFRALMTCPEEKIKSQFKHIFKRFDILDAENREKQLVDLVDRLYKQFPDDVGCFVVYFLNYMKLNPLEAIYLDANLPHAYLSGDCVECMACSDNVVRAGLTPKYKDVETLCDMLDYSGQSAISKIFKPVEENKYTVIFKPPVPDFAVAKIEVRDQSSELPLITRNSGSILLIITGTAVHENIHLLAGVSLFIPAQFAMTLTSVSNDFLAFQATANV